VTRVPPERFDEPHIEQLLVELIPTSRLPVPIERGLVAGLSAVLADVLRRVGVEAQYVHVGTADYRKHDGAALAAATPAAIAEDQHTARAGYLMPAMPNLTKLLERLQGGVRGAHDRDGLRAALRKFAKTLFGGNRVPLRDLADHAPINYVSLFSGRA
jgi:hypothetical protein